MKLPAVSRRPRSRPRSAGIFAAHAATVCLLSVGGSESWAVKADGTTKTTCVLKYNATGTPYWVMRIDPLEVQSFQLTVQFDPSRAQLDPSYGLNFGTDAVLSKEAFTAMQTTVGGPLPPNEIQVSGSRPPATLSPGDVDIFELRFVAVGNPLPAEVPFTVYANAARGDFLIAIDSVTQLPTTFNAAQIGPTTRIATPGVNPLVWDPGGAYNAGGTGGSGTWDTTSIRFDNLPSPPAGVPVPVPNQFTDVSWNNGLNAHDIAVFGGNPGTGLVTVSGTVSVGGLQFDMPGYTLQGGSLTLSAPPGATPTIDTGENGATISTALVAGSVAAGLRKLGSGTLTLNGNNTYTGATVVLDGVVAISADNNLGVASNALVLDGGMLTIAGSFTTNRSITLGTGGGTIGVSGASVVTRGPFSTISGGGGLTKVGTGAIVLDGSNTYAGPTQIAGGTIQLSGAQDALPMGTALRISSNGTLDLNGSGQTVGSLANLGSAGGTILNLGGLATLTVGTDDSSTLFSGTISGLTHLAKVGSGALTLAGLQHYSGLLVTDGTVNLNSPLSNATINESNGTLNVNANTGNLTINNVGGTLNLNGSVTSSLINHGSGVLNVHANATNSIINADAIANIDASQTLAELNIGESAIVTLLQAPGPSPLPDFDADFASDLADPVEAVPEPETIVLLGVGMPGLLRRRSRHSP